MPILDPTRVRLSDTVLLSDMMGCDSVYRYGYANNIRESEKTKLKQGMKIAERIDELQYRFGACSIAYGFLSDSLSKKIVKYQDPSKPSYHRWELGGASDICFHNITRDNIMPPVTLAHAIDEQYPDYSRMITYSESPWICLSTNINEKKQHRRAFYENRYAGEHGSKPKWVTKPSNPADRLKHGKNLKLEHDWRGAGYPSYHGGGRRQYHHRRLSKYTFLSDLLYYKHYVGKGTPNQPKKSDKGRLERAGLLVDTAVEEVHGKRVSIVQGYNHQKWGDTFEIQIVLPVGSDYENVAHALSTKEHVVDIRLEKRKSDTRKIRIISN